MSFATSSDTFFPDDKQTNASVLISKGLVKAEKSPYSTPHTFLSQLSFWISNVFVTTFGILNLC